MSKFDGMWSYYDFDRSKIADLHTKEEAKAMIGEESDYEGFAWMPLNLDCCPEAEIFAETDDREAVGIVAPFDKMRAVLIEFGVYTEDEIEDVDGFIYSWRDDPQSQSLFFPTPEAAMEAVRGWDEECFLLVCDEKEGWLTHNDPAATKPFAWGITDQSGENMLDAETKEWVSVC